MNYKELVEKIGRKTDTPSKEFLDNEDGFHIIVTIGAIVDGSFCSFEIIHCEPFLLARDLVEERGAVRGEDYFISCFVSGSFFKIALHTTHAFLSDEDFDPSIKRTGKKIK